MSLRAKFNIVLLLVFLLGLGVSGALFYRILQKNARDEVTQNASVMMASALSVRGYTVGRIKPLLEGRMHETFLPEIVPAFAATEVFENLRKQYQEFQYKEATLNPTNPRNRAADWESDIIQQFRNMPDRAELVGERDTPTGRALFLARPIKIESAACLDCHGLSKDAPATLLAQYGSSNGFGWKLKEIVGAQIVSIPMDIPIKKAERAFYTFIGSLVAVFMVVFLVLNVMLRRIVIRPIMRMSKAAEEVSMGNMDVPEFHLTGSDEVSQLANSFNRMRRSLEKAMKMLE